MDHLVLTVRRPAGHVWAEEVGVFLRVQHCSEFLHRRCVSLDRRSHFAFAQDDVRIIRNEKFRFGVAD
jgi:hypothetical protein